MNRKQEHLVRAREQRQRSVAELPKTIELGNRLRHRHLGTVGTVVELRGAKITLEVSGRRVQTTADQLELPGESDRAPAAPTGGVRAEFQAADVKKLIELDLRGRDLADAWAELDKTIDRCSLEGLQRLTVIHGKGTGVLRRGLNERLKRDPRVLRAAIGGGGQHDDGVTVVELR
jgi:DNA mismatch repair protein MutS2